MNNQNSLGFCKKCNVDLVTVDSGDEKVIKTYCPKCLKQWEFHLDDQGFLCKAVEIEPNKANN